MAKVLLRVTEPSHSAEMVHYQPYPGADLVTLCGKTDFIKEVRGEETDRPVTCRMCIAIVKYVRGSK